MWVRLPLPPPEKELNLEKRKEYRPTWQIATMAFDGKCQSCAYKRSTGAICEYEGILAWAVKELGDIAMVDGRCQWCGNPETEDHKDYCVWAMFQDFLHANEAHNKYMCLLLWATNNQRSERSLIEQLDNCHCPELRTEAWELQKSASK
jgi:hypothetical protein